MFIKVKCLKDVIIKDMKVYSKGRNYYGKIDKTGILKSVYEVKSHAGVGVFDKKDFNKNFKVVEKSKINFEEC